MRPLTRLGPLRDALKKKQKSPRSDGYANGRAVSFVHMFSSGRGFVYSAAPDGESRPVCHSGVRCVSPVNEVRSPWQRRSWTAQDVVLDGPLRAVHP